MKTIKYFICVAFLALSGSALADSFTFVTPPGSMTGGGPVDASAVFTTSTNSLSITLTNLEANITDVAQALSDLSFTLSNASGALSSLTSSSGQEITVASGGTFSTGPTVAAGWVFSNPSANNFLLDVLGAGGAGPTHLIIGPPDGSNLYSAANGSIAGNPAHNPFLNQTATFVLDIPGINVDTTVTGATFSFGTTEGLALVPGTNPETVPDGGTTSLLLGFALSGLGVMRRWVKS